MVSYLITDPKYYGNDPFKFGKYFDHVLRHHQVDMVCFRDKVSQNIDDLVEQFIKVAKEHHIQQIFINSSLELAEKYDVGVHLTSAQFDQIEVVKQKNMKSIISCHNDSEIEKALEKGIDYVTYSPIFSTPNKGEPKGINNLKNIVERYPLPIFALGGIVEDTQIEDIKKTGCFGFASIRYFTK
jgi:thiamine-phosphate pyrophosphorylase